MFLHLTCVHICKYWLFLAIKFRVVCSLNVLVYMMFVSLQLCCFLFRYLTLFSVSIINKVIDVKDYVDGIALLEVDIYSAIMFKYSCLVNSCGMKNPIFFANLFPYHYRLKHTQCLSSAVLNANKQQIFSQNYDFQNGNNVELSCRLYSPCSSDHRCC